MASSAPAPLPPPPPSQRGLDVLASLSSNDPKKNPSVNSPTNPGTVLPLVTPRTATAANALSTITLTQQVPLLPSLLPQPTGGKVPVDLDAVMEDGDEKKSDPATGSSNTVASDGTELAAPVSPSNPLGLPLLLGPASGGSRRKHRRPRPAGITRYSSNDQKSASPDHELCIHAQLHCASTCTAVITKSHRFQHAARARHEKCDCAWVAYRDQQKKRNNKHKHLFLRTGDPVKDAELDRERAKRREERLRRARVTAERLAAKAKSEGRTAPADSQTDAGSQGDSGATSPTTPLSGGAAASRASASQTPAMSSTGMPLSPLFPFGGAGASVSMSPLAPPLDYQTATVASSALANVTLVPHPGSFVPYVASHAPLPNLPIIRPTVLPSWPTVPAPQSLTVA